MLPASRFVAKLTELYDLLLLQYSYLTAKTVINEETTGNDTEWYGK